MKPAPSNPPADWIARIFADSHVAIGISRLADNRFVAVNDAFERLFNLRRKAVLGRTAAELGLWPIPEERANLIAMLQRGEAVRAYEAKFRKRSGEIGDLQISASIVSLDGERYLIGLLTDISDRKREELAAKSNQDRLNTVLMLSDILAFHQDRQLRYTWIANPALGATTKDILGRNDDEILGQQDAKPLTAIKRRVLRSGQGEHQELWVTRGKQSGCYDLIVEPERDAEGRITGVICAAADITQRKQALDKLQLQADILEALEEDVNLVDAQGILRYTNPKFDTMFGYAPGELIGNHVSVLNAPGNKSPEATAQAITRALRRDGHWSGEIKNRRKDGSEFWTRANVAATTHPAFGPVWISAQSDVSALHMAEAEVKAAYSALGRLTDHVQDEVENQRRELAREVHDEIGATLTGIRMRIERLALLQPGGAVGDVLAQLDHALETTRTLCSGLRPPILDDLGLIETLRWYVRDWSRRSGIRATARIAELDAEPGDPLRTDVFRMLQELLTNVARHSGATQVTVSLTQPRAVLQLRVTDNGHGFTPESTEGFGLLGIRERLRRHHGALHIECRRGTTTTLRIPLPTR